MDLDKAIKERHTCRRFSTKSVDWKDIIKALESARLSPLAGNISSMRFIVVTEDEKIQELADACQQDFIGKVELVVVFCSDKTQAERSYGERGTIYSRQQAGASIENFLLKITELGLATCWTGAFVDEQVKRILQIPENVDIEAIFPVGYEMPPKAKQRLKPELDKILYFNTWKNRHMGGLKTPWA